MKSVLFSLDNMIESLKMCGDFVNLKNERIICFNVSKTYLGCERPNLYECTRKYWRLNGQRANNADLVFAICRGISLGSSSRTVGSRLNTRNTKEDGNLKENKYLTLLTRIKIYQRLYVTDKIL